MYKIALFIFIVSSVSLSAYSDYDMDGVEDKHDKCPNTMMSELVGTDGCTVKDLQSPHHFDIIYGLSYSQDSYEITENANNITQNLQLDYYYKNFSLQASSAYYNSDSVTYNNSGMNDSFLGAYYKLNPENEKMSIRLGVGVIIPTYESGLNNNNADYTASVSFSYLIDNMNLFCGYALTIVNDTDIRTNTERIIYQNTDSVHAGVGFYPTDALYVSGSYTNSDSIYKGVAKLETASFYALYNIDTHWFTSANYAYGLSKTASDNFASLRVGYYF
ncbi:DUF3187 domain-containing protein [bacterium]|nr:DUF3187 domain-containing protein [bacterium]MBU1995032.1 DUF3187 domain-containing protein [bacterium]